MLSSTASDLGTEVGPCTARIIRAVKTIWPGHEKFLRSSFAARSPELLYTTEIISSLLDKTATYKSKSIEEFAEDYRFMCEKIVYPEELYFRRNGEYRLKTFEDANTEVYSNDEVMSRYMNGLFVSDVLWLNHASAMNDFAKVYLPTLAVGGRHLEIGPGHGMLLHLALQFGAFGAYSAWDVSATSIALVHEILDMLGESNRVNLQLTDMYSEDALAENRGNFDAVVLSEVLEHLERPRAALEIIRELLAPGGTVWINVPANGPAPDHLFLLRSPNEAQDIVRAAGLEIVRTASFPVTGSSLERAIRQELPVSCVLVARRAR